MGKLLNISCSKATLLVSKKEETRLSFLEGIRLRLHMGICRACRLFEQQSRFVAKNAGNAHLHSDACLTDEQKERMANLLKDS